MPGPPVPDILDKTASTRVTQSLPSSSTVKVLVLLPLRLKIVGQEYGTGRGSGDEDTQLLLRARETFWPKILAESRVIVFIDWRSVYFQVTYLATSLYLTFHNV